MAKFAQCGFSALVPSVFDATAPAQTRAHLSDGQCQRICLRHLLYPATTSSMRMVSADVLLTKPSARTSGASRFYGFCRKIREPTSGLEPLSCSLRVITHALQGFAEGCKCRISK